MRIFPPLINCLLSLKSIVLTRSESTKYKKFIPVHLEYTGRPGRPRKIIDRQWLQESLSGKTSIASIAKLAEVSPKHVFRTMERYDLHREFTALTDEDLDLLIRAYKVDKPNASNRFVAAFFHMHGLRIQRERVRYSVARVDALGSALRQRDSITRREYKVPRTNALWHCDGHHKLIAWGIVIHGFIDGYDRTVSASLLLY